MTLKRTPKRSRTPEERLASHQWKLHVLCGATCAVPGCDDPNLEAHHVITQQQLRRHGYGDKLWDPRNGMALCTFHHTRHTLARERIPFELIPPAAVEFATELGLDWLLDRYYPRAA